MKNPKMKFFMSVPDRLIAKLFESQGHVHIEDPKQAQLVLFPGGADIIPILYGERPLQQTHYNFRRDLREIKIWRNLPKHVVKVGICRGAQFLNVMNGGAMWQHVSGHVDNHELRDMETADRLWVNSTHHQMMIPNINLGQVIAAGNAAIHLQSEGQDITRPSNAGKRDWIDPEVVVYPLTNTVCFQPHPEYEHKPTTEYFWEIFDRHVYGNPKQRKA